MLTVTNPANGEEIAKLETATTEDIQSAFHKSSSFLKTWRRTPLGERCHIIQGFAQKLQENIDSCAAILTREMGKPLAHAKGEINATVMRTNWFIENAAGEMDDETMRFQGKIQEVISQEPLGIIANISAWNFPYFVGTNVFIPALLTGNCVLYKPSEFTSMTGLKIAELLYESGLPLEAFQCLVGEAQVGSDILKTEIDGVFFTGSVATGKKIALACRERMIPLGLELGGKDPTYVCDDVSPQQTAEQIADGCFFNAGQSCCSVERIYVHEKIYDEFLQHFKAFTESIVMGDPMLAETYLGPLTRSEQSAVLQSQLSDAVAKGAKILVAGGPVEGKGNFFRPQVMVDVDHTMSIMKDESFGPIIGIQKVGSDHQAIELMNDTDYGLTAGVYTVDKTRAHAILTEVNAGTAYWNCCDRVSPYLPWSGRKQSGLGSTLSKIGIRAFTQPKAWHLNHP